MCPCVVFYNDGTPLPLLRAACQPIMSGYVVAVIYASPLPHHISLEQMRQSLVLNNTTSSNAGGESVLASHYVARLIAHWNLYNQVVENLSTYVLVYTHSLNC